MNQPHEATAFELTTDQSIVQIDLNREGTTLLSKVLHLSITIKHEGGLRKFYFHKGDHTEGPFEIRTIAFNSIKDGYSIRLEVPSNTDILNVSLSNINVAE